MTTPTLDPLTMKRLAFTRLLYQQGVDQSHLPEPLNCISVLAFHDAVEHFLLLTGDHLGLVPPKNLEFMKYWEVLHPDKLNGGVALSGRLGMDRLNRSRRDFKHVGTMPSLATIELARADVSAFLEDNTPKVFGIQFGGIDMADLVSNENVCSKVKEAVTVDEEGNRTEAMALLKEAFNELFHGQVKSDSYPPSPFSFGDDIDWPMSERDIYRVLARPDDRSSGLIVDGADYLARQFRKVSAATSAMQGALRVMALGIDYAGYHRFLQLTPYIDATYGDPRIVSTPDGYAPSREEFDYCHQFVITAALRMADVEARMIPPSWQAGEAGP